MTRDAASSGKSADIVPVREPIFRLVSACWSRRAKAAAPEPRINGSRDFAYKISRYI